MPISSVFMVKPRLPHADPSNADDVVIFRPPPLPSARLQATLETTRQRQHAADVHTREMELLDRLLAMVSGTGANKQPHGEDEKLAVAALLIEAGRMDERFDAQERQLIRELLTGRFDLDPAELDRIVATAEKRVEESEQYYPFTDVICKRLSGPERVEIIEMLWRVAYADGQLDSYEDALIRQVAALIHVEDRDRANARQRALASLDAADRS